MKDIISGIFLLFSIIISNYIYPTLGKRINYFIKNNYYVKLIILYILIYFTINFTAQDTIHVIEHLKNTTILFLLFILFTKVNLYISLALFILIIINYTFNKHIEYLNKYKNKKEKLKYEIYSSNITKIIIILSISGFIYEIHDKDNIIRYVFSDN
tara:strand:- start:428 stop:895 length:468 start_codon:yes stop_codon:yes gene_type:complete